MANIQFPTESSESKAEPGVTIEPQSPVEHPPHSPADSWVQKWPDPPPKEWKPFLSSFTLFQNFPIEIRQMIWKLTLQPRVVEISYKNEHGFYSRVKTPVALRVCRDSRDAVGHLYPLRFGSAVDDLATTFNFSLDTLYFDGIIGEHVIHFLALLKEEELSQIRYLAFDHLINEYLEYVEAYNHDNFALLRKAARAMPELKEVLVVYKLDECHHEHGFPDGTGTIQLYEKFPWDIYEYMHCEGYHLDDEDGESECQELPNSEHLVAGFAAPKTGSIWGWRETKVEIITPPWCQ